MYQFHFTAIYVTVQFEAEGKVPEYKSSAFRGGIGRQLLNMYCVGNQECCDKCIFQKKCIVQNIMYAPFQIKPDYVTSGESAGYSISCVDTRTWVNVGDEIKFRIILYGDTAAYFNPIIQAIFGLGKNGLGGGAVPFHIMSIKNRYGSDILTGETINIAELMTETVSEYIADRREEICWESGVKIYFQSPCTIRSHGKLLQQFEEEAVLKAIWRRVSMQHLFEGYVIEPMFLLQKSCMKEQYSDIKKVRRYSERNEEKMQLKGIVGWMKMEDLSENVIKLLLAGEITCVGKNTRFGFGVYKVENI